MMTRNLTTSTKANPPANSVATQLVLTNLLLALADLGGNAGYFALLLTLVTMPSLVGGLSMKMMEHILVKAGHAGNDLLVINQLPKSFFGWIQLISTLAFSAFFAFMQNFQLQSSKVRQHSSVEVLLSIYFFK